MKIFELESSNKIVNKYDKLIVNILLILVIIFPISLLTGPFIPDFTITISSIVFIYICLKYNLSKYFNNSLIKYLFLFWIIIIFCSLLSDNIFFSIKSSLFYIRFILFSSFVWFLIENYKNFLKLFFFSLIITLSFVFIDSIVQFHFGTSLTGFTKPSFRLTGPFDDRQIVGSYVSRLLPLFIFLYYFFYSKINKKTIFFISLLSLLVLISGERTSFFMITLFLFSIIFLFSKRFINIFLIFCVYFIASIFIVVTNLDLKERVINQTLQGFGIKKYTNETGEQKYFDAKPTRGFYIFSQAHEHHYRTALKMFKGNIFVGVGPNMFRKKCSDKKYYIATASCTTHPHNFFLQLLAETGLIGAIFYLSLFFILIFKILKVLYLSKIKNIELEFKNYKLYILHMGFFINIFVFILPNGNYFNNYLNAIIYIPLGFYLYQINKHE